MDPAFAPSRCGLSCYEVFASLNEGENYLQALGIDLHTGLPRIASCFDKPTRKRLLSSQLTWPLIAESAFQDRVPATKDLLQRASSMDFANCFAEGILVKVDRASVLHSLEVRAPFLDSRVIEFAFGKRPSQMKATPIRRKILLKLLAARVLPTDFDFKRKQGLTIPLSEWLQSRQFRDLFRTVLLDPSCNIDKRTIRDLLSGQGRGRLNSERLFALILFELWRNEYSVSM
jgi:asparagine synthase (glutamine-hydrolysing)